MSYESRAYDRLTDFGPQPVVVLVVTGTHDVSGLINLLAGAPPVIEQGKLGERIRRQVRRHNGGRAALELLRQRGGPDFTSEPDGFTAWTEYELVVHSPAPVRDGSADEVRMYADSRYARGVVKLLGQRDHARSTGTRYQLRARQMTISPGECAVQP